MKEAAPFWLATKLPKYLVDAALRQIAAIPDGFWIKSPTYGLSDKRRSIYTITPDKWDGNYGPINWEAGFRETPLFTGALKEINLEIQRIMNDGVLGYSYVSEMGGFASVYPHVDPGDYYAKHHRVQVCLQAGPKTVFTAGSGAKVFQPGECWVFDNTLLHGVLNGDSKTRVAFIVDIQDNLLT